MHFLQTKLLILRVNFTCWESFYCSYIQTCVYTYIRTYIYVYTHVCVCVCDFKLVPFILKFELILCIDFL